MTAPITWAEATSPILWSNIGINWNTAALGNSVTVAVAVDKTLNVDQGIGFAITFGTSVGQTLADVPTYAEAIALALAAAQATTVVTTKPEAILLAAEVTSPVTDRLDATESLEFAVKASARPPPTYSVSVGMLSSTSFLWNEEDDVTTTWTKVDYPN